MIFFNICLYIQYIISLSGLEPKNKLENYCTSPRKLKRRKVDIVPLIRAATGSCRDLGPEVVLTATAAGWPVCWCELCMKWGGSQVSHSAVWCVFVCHCGAICACLHACVTSSAPYSWRLDAVQLKMSTCVICHLQKSFHLNPKDGSRVRQSVRPPTTTCPAFLPFYFIGRVMTDVMLKNDQTAALMSSDSFGPLMALSDGVPPSTSLGTVLSVQSGHINIVYRKSAKMSLFSAARGPKRKQQEAVLLLLLNSNVSSWSWCEALPPHWLHVDHSAAGCD